MKQLVVLEKTKKQQEKPHVGYGAYMNYIYDNYYFNKNLLLHIICYMVKLILWHYYFHVHIRVSIIVLLTQHGL